MSLYDWSVTAATNDAADANINWSEGQNANTVNNSARAMMAAIAAFLEQINGTAASGSSGTNAYTLTSATGNALSVYAAGNLVCFTADHTNDGAASLNMDGLGAKALKKFGSSDVAAGDIAAGNLVVAAYDGTNFQILSPVANSNLEAFSAQTASANTIAYFDSANTMATTGFTAQAIALLDDVSFAGMRSTLGVEIGGDVQAQSTNLQELSDISGASNTIPYFNGSSSMTTTTFTSQARSLLADSSSSDMRATLSIPDNTREITYGTSAPGALGTGEIYLQHDS